MDFSIAKLFLTFYQIIADELHREVNHFFKSIEMYSYLQFYLLSEGFWL